VQSEFADAGVKFTPSTLTKSDLFGELHLLISTGRVELLDDPTLRTELLALERRPVRGGKDSIDHPRGAHDDVANAAAGALVHVDGIGTKKKTRVFFGWREHVRFRRATCGAAEGQATRQAPLLGPARAAARAAARGPGCAYAATMPWCCNPATLYSPTTVRSASQPIGTNSGSPRP